jgi:hypothetical protein
VHSAVGICAACADCNLIRALQHVILIGSMYSGVVAMWALI